ncbi:hypothetical protein PCANC_14600 [Puccinia coronata f. sp. avenae]|uniref:Uncharacterized protein n=1 Tax=Puccinia coronata f. sp. avenae TaxID=200324 RepID=A0A2N5UGD5_9BASI|nr:hypothetical protein PCANC_14600 [Puccinia coronata f. sp. avenae]
MQANLPSEWAEAPSHPYVSTQLPEPPYVTQKVGAKDITFLNTQDSKYLPSSQYIKDFIKVINQNSPHNEGGKVTSYKVSFEPETPDAAPSGPTSSRHKVGARRCIIRCIKAPLVPNSVILKSARQATQENHEIKPSHQSEALICKSLHYKLICWYHEAQ